MDDSVALWLGLLLKASWHTSPIERLSTSLESLRSQSSHGLMWFKSGTLSHVEWFLEWFKSFKISSTPSWKSWTIFNLQAWISALPPPENNRKPSLFLPEEVPTLDLEYSWQTGAFSLLLHSLTLSDDRANVRTLDKCPLSSFTGFQQVNLPSSNSQLRNL